MIADLSILRLSTAMARHAADVHRATSDNISRVDVPGATAREVEGFGSAMNRLLADGSARTIHSGRAISLDQQMAQMATNAARHNAATTVWAKSLDLIRLAGAAPR